MQSHLPTEFFIICSSASMTSSLKRFPTSCFEFPPWQTSEGFTFLRLITFVIITCITHKLQRRVWMRISVSAALSKSNNPGKRRIRSKFSNEYWSKGVEKNGVINGMFRERTFTIWGVFFNGCCTKTPKHTSAKSIFIRYLLDILIGSTKYIDWILIRRAQFYEFSSQTSQIWRRVCFCLRELSK